MLDAAKEGADAVLSLTQTIAAIVTTIVVTAWGTVVALAKGKSVPSAAMVTANSDPKRQQSNSEQLQSVVVELRKQLREAELRLDDRLRLLSDEIRGDLARAGTRVDGHSASLAAVARNLTSLSATVNALQTQLNEHERGAQALVEGLNHRLKAIYEAGVGAWHEPLSFHDGGLKIEGILEIPGKK